MQAFDGDPLGLSSQQDVADLAAHFLVAGLEVTTRSFTVLGDGVASSFAVAGLPSDVSLVLSLLVAVWCAALVVRSMAGADGQVVLGAAVGAHDVLWLLDVQRFQRHGFRYPDLNVKAVAPAVPRRLRAVVFHRYEPDGSDVHLCQGTVGA